MTSSNTLLTPKKIIAKPTCIKELTVYYFLSFMGTRGGK
jgi:hypothetical protein